MRTIRVTHRQSKSDRLFDILNYSFLCFLLIIYIYPILWIVSASVSNPNDVWLGKVWLLPKGVSLLAYDMILHYKTIWIGYRNTIIYTLLGTAINVTVTIMAAYPLSRKDFAARNILMGLYSFTMFFNGGLIPTYLLIKGLELLDSIWVMVLPNAVAVWNLIITRTFFQTSIPDELREAAEMDGCTNVRFLLKVVIPLSTSIIAVMTLFYGVAHWNSFFNGLIYLSSERKYPLQLILREILVLTDVDDSMYVSAGQELAEKMRVAETIKYGVIIVASLPVLMMYPFVQRHFVKGVMLGSIKG